MTDERIRRSRISGMMEGEGFSLAALAADPRTRGIDFGAADLNGTGTIDGHEEYEVLTRLLDGLDGRRDGWITLGRHGRATPARPVLEALAERAALPVLRWNLESRPASVSRGVVVVGMSETAYAEAAALRRRAPVLLVTDGRGPHAAPPGHVQLPVIPARDGDPLPPMVETAARRHETTALRTREEIHRFVSALGLPEVQTRVIDAVIANAPESGRAELAELARVWAPAERGESIPSRLVLSGHGDGEQIFGDDQDSLRSEDIRGLARAMPRAAARIESLHIGACQHGYETRVQAWRAAFPNLRSVWAYAGFSSSGRAAHQQQAAWERGSREPQHGPRELHPGLARGTRRGENVAVWTREAGYRGPAQRDLGVILGELAAGFPDYERYVTGEEVVADPRSGPVTERYLRLQDVMAHSDFRDQPAELRRWVTVELDRALRLRFFTMTVTRAFDRHYARAITDGYRAMGMSPPTFETMSRRQVLAEVERFGREVRSRPDAPREAVELSRLLVEGLVELRASRIPTEWV